MWSYCAECGMVWQDGREVCEVNGAGAKTIPVDPVVGRELIDYANKYGDLENALRAVEKVLLEALARQDLNQDRAAIMTAQELADAALRPDA